jgi:hypothetical protein
MAFLSIIFCISHFLQLPYEQLLHFLIIAVLFDRNMKNQQKMNERELSLGLTGTQSSWHSQYADSAWVFVGGLPYDLTEGDVICIFSQ